MFYGWRSLLFVLFFFFSLQSVLTKVTVELLLHNYENKNSKKASGFGCDVLKLSCDVKFIICIKLGKLSTCINKSSTKVYRQANSINFDNENLVDKQFTRSFTEPYKGIISLFIEARDKDIFSDQLIDEYNSVLNIAVSPESTQCFPYNVTQLGKYKSGSNLRYSVKVYCSQGYYGNDCTRYCDKTSELCNPDSCKEDIFGDDSFKGIYRFNETQVNMTNIIPCKYNEVANVTRKCTSILGTGPYWMDPDFEACDTATNKKLNDLNKIPLCNDELGNSSCWFPDQIIQKANEIVDSSSLITTQQEVSLVSRIINEVVLNSTSAEKISSGMLNLVDKLLEVNSSILSEAQTITNSSRNILSSLDLLAVLMAGDPNATDLNITKSNIALNGRIVNNTNTYITTFQNHEKQMQVIISNEEKSRGMLASILIPGNSFSNTNNSIYSIVYTNPNLFTTNNSLVIKSSTENSTKTGVAASIVLSATVANQMIVNLKSPVLVKFKIINVINLTGKYDCYFWNFTLDYWSNVGCRFVSKYNYTVTCECDHLTNFALIFDVSQDKKTTIKTIGNEASGWISLIGCAVSLVGLFLTALNLVLFKKLRQKLPMKILFCLSMSLMAMLTVFLSGVNRGSSSIFSCHLVAGLLHYFILTSFCWTAVEGLNLYFNFVTIFKTYSPNKFILLSSIFAWGFPLIIIILTASLGGYSDVDAKICIIRHYYFYYGLLTPVAVILLLNFFTFCIVMKKINASKFNKSGHYKHTLYSSRIAFSCSTLLGLSWVFGIFALEKVAKHFQILFVIFNSLQGFFIFVFYIARNPEIQSEWRLLLNKLIVRDKKNHKMGVKNEGYVSDLSKNASENFSNLTDLSVTSK
ncbi:adhesion G-protein coupled receptor G6 isoform X5 [Hydra vulgaris]|uniref:Adhesion G-protein coupled receptor G6 isoform X5 n=1 Tax=Hydra vulgaris TaxID=6087 RepID=A0ABM4B4X3_HYDVU